MGMPWLIRSVLGGGEKGMVAQVSGGDTRF